MSLNDRDYKELAQAIVADYTDQSIPLRDSLVKVADEQSFNVHETRRLLETTNVHAHLALFKQASDEKYVQFEVIDPKDVCGELFGRVDTACDDGSSEKLAAYVEVDHHLELPDEHHRDLRPEIEKIASAGVPEVSEPVHLPYDGERGYHAYAVINKVANEMENLIQEKYIEYNEVLEKIANDYKSIYADDFEEFEKDAYSLHGDVVTHAVHTVCELLRRKPNNVKTANHYAIDKPVHEKLARAVALYTDIKDRVHALDWYTKQAGPLLDD